MTPYDFKKMTDKIFTECDLLLNSKNKEYARNNDKLHNFKVAARTRGLTPESALGGMMLKHTISIYDYINDSDDGLFHPLSQWDEKIKDHINYLLLLRALIVERENIEKHLCECGDKNKSGD